MPNDTTIAVPGGNIRITHWAASADLFEPQALVEWRAVGGQSTGSVQLPPWVLAGLASADTRPRILGMPVEVDPNMIDNEIRFRYE